MRDGGSKAKGSSFERELAKKLSLWLTNGKREDILWRSAMSGGRATVGRGSGKVLSSQAGDLSAIDPLGYPFINKFYTEIKHYKKLSIDRLLTGSGDLMNFWKTAKKEAMFYKKIPFLVAKQNYLPSLVCTSNLGVHMLSARNSVDLASPKYGINIITIDQFIKGASAKRLSGYNYLRADRDFRLHKSNAGKRSIELLFSFDEWVEWWEENLGPDWQSKRGCHKGQYVMARNNDRGHYLPENVKCLLHEDNSSEKVSPCGEEHFRSKLTEEKVLEIYYDQRSATEVAVEYNISDVLVSSIRRKKAWKHLVADLPDDLPPPKRCKPGPKQILTDAQIIEISDSEEKVTQLAKKYRVSIGTVYNKKKIKPKMG